MAQFRMTEKPVDSVLELPLDLLEGWVVQLQELTESLILSLGLDYLSEEMSVVQRFAKDEIHLFVLVHVEDVRDLGENGLLFVPREFNCWEGELTLLHVVVYRFVEVVAHVGL